MVCATLGSSLRLVVVEPDAVLRRFLCKTLEEDGHQVVAEAITGPEMMRIALTLEFETLVFDRDLPGTDGVQVLRHIYDERPVAGVAIVSNRDQAAVRAGVVELGLTYLVKPIPAHQVTPAVVVAWAQFEKNRTLANENDSLRRELENRKLIERAKGVLMKRHHLSEDEAYRRLQRTAMNNRTPMVRLAHSVLNGGSLALAGR